jgi:serine/threonine-protein kinase SRPK3
MALQMLKGLDFLHRVCHIIHTDLKPENVLLDLPTKSHTTPSAASLHTQSKEYSHTDASNANNRVMGTKHTTIQNTTTCK